MNDTDRLVFTASRDTLLAALDTVRLAVPDDVDYLARRGVLVESDGNDLWVRAGDGAWTMSMRVPDVVFSPGRLVVHRDQFVAGLDRLEIGNRVVADTVSVTIGAPERHGRSGPLGRISWSRRSTFARRTIRSRMGSRAWRGGSTLTRTGWPPRSPRSR
jgi:hypothetical protein